MFCFGFLQEKLRHFAYFCLNNRQISSVDNTIYISYDEPILDIEFVGLSFKSIGRVKYRYRLNKTENWQHTDNNQLTLNNIDPGEYKLEIQASNGENEWSHEPALLSINVAYPFWQTTPFIIIASILVLLLLFFINKMVVKRVKNKENLKRQIQSLRFEALSAQMNPHFMFNSLNSIQNFIMQNEKKASIRYLSKFARLMRMTLNHSQSKNITLQEELSALQLYMDLERLRFDEQFNYNLSVNSEISQENTLIPALLIQPIVENAILHGLRPKKGLGLVQVEIQHTNGQLMIQISDNGVGRSVSNSKKRDGHESKGSALTEERITLFAKDFDSPYHYEIIDLKEDGTAIGTKVEISIPCITKTTDLK